MATCACCPGIAALPGTVVPLNDKALPDAWDQQREHIETSGDDVHYINRLPLIGGTVAKATSAPAPAAAVATTAEAAPAAPKAEVTKPTTATHVLLGMQALPLRGDRVALGDAFALRREQASWVLEGDGALVNGLPCAPGQPLSLGDTLSLGSTGHGRLIEVLD